jgi:hypothetical protein
MWSTWTRTVATLMLISVAICRVEKPRATSSASCVSRGESRLFDSASGSGLLIAASARARASSWLMA